MKTSLIIASSDVTSQADESSESSIIMLLNIEKNLIKFVVAVIFSRCRDFINLTSSVMKSFAENFN